MEFLSTSIDTILHVTPHISLNLDQNFKIQLRNVPDRKTTLRRTSKAMNICKDYFILNSKYPPLGLVFGVLKLLLKRNHVRLEVKRSHAHQPRACKKITIGANLESQASRVHNSDAKSLISFGSHPIHFDDVSRIEIFTNKLPPPLYLHICTK